LHGGASLDEFLQPAVVDHPDIELIEMGRRYA
jgi:hypothetical protein